MGCGYINVANNAKTTISFHIIQLFDLYLSCKSDQQRMNPKFEVVFLEQAIEFMANIDHKPKAKIYYNIDKAKLTNDPKLFKKLEFGNSGQNISDFNTDYSPFGTKQTKLKHSSWRLTEL